MTRRPGSAAVSFMEKFCNWNIGVMAVVLIVSALAKTTAWAASATSPSTQPTAAAPSTQPSADMTPTTPQNFDTNKYIAEGDFPGSIMIPGTHVSFQVGGFVQLDAIADNNAIASPDSFIVSSIPTNTGSVGQTNFSVKQTRLFVKTSAPTNMGPLITYIEGDFFSSTGTQLRLRHAYGQIGDKDQFLAGQTWTTFMDASTYPAIFDYQGPNGMVLVRQPMVRYTHIAEDNWQFQAALEDPTPDLSQAPGTVGRESSRLPDAIANARWSPQWGHLQAAAIIRELTWDPDTGSTVNKIGWGGNFSGTVNIGKPLAPSAQDNVVFEVTGGKGIANYFNDTNGLGADGFVNAANNFSPMTIWGGFAAYQHYWAQQWASVFGYSYLHVDNTADQPGTAYRDGQYLVANIMWYPTDRIWTGIEMLYGIRQDFDRNKGNDLRVSFSIQYRF